MRNYVWGDKEIHGVGTHEFVNFCRRVGAEPFYCVNFLSDGEARCRTMREADRSGDAQEAADWSVTPMTRITANARTTGRRSR
jgi:alpha-L-arabinofuranosidase